MSVVSLVSLAVLVEMALEAWATYDPPLGQCVLAHLLATESLRGALPAYAGTPASRLKEKTIRPAAIDFKPECQNLDPQ